MSESIAFALPGGPLQARFDGPHLTSDGGLCWLAEADRALGLCAALAPQIPEWRHGPVRHALATLVRQRVLQIACGYEDQNDAATLRSDPLLKLVCGRLPQGGGSSQPTDPLAPGERRRCQGVLPAGPGAGAALPAGARA